MFDWINYDIDTKPGSTVIRLDLARGSLPHGDSSVDYVFSEHFIEHITKPQGVALFREIYRVLKPEGVFRFSTPDLNYLVANYARWRNQQPIAPIPSVWAPKSACDMVNEGMRLWGHQYLWDSEELSAVLWEVGFKSAWDCQWHKSVHEALRDLEVRPFHGEIIIEAAKSPLRL